jgi:hypothetical protein
LILFPFFPNFFIVSSFSMIGVVPGGGDSLVRSTHLVCGFFVTSFLLRLDQPNFERHVLCSCFSSILCFFCLLVSFCFSRVSLVLFAFSHFSFMLAIDYWNCRPMIDFNMFPVTSLSFSLCQSLSTNSFVKSVIFYTICGLLKSRDASD